MKPLDIRGTMKVKRRFRVTLKELRLKSGMSRSQFCEYFGIPYRTLQDWELGNRKCPEYLLTLMEYKLKHEGLI